MKSRQKVTVVPSCYNLLVPDITIVSIQSPKDLNAFQSVIKTAFSATPDADITEWYSFDQAKASLSGKQGTAFLAKIGDTVVGAIHAQPESPIFGREGSGKWQITNIGVVPEHQRQGIGGKLLKAVETVAKAKLGTKAIVHTNPDDRVAVGFYIKYGYRTVGILDNYYYRGPAQFFIKQI